MALTLVPPEAHSAPTLAFAPADLWLETWRSWAALFLDPRQLRSWWLADLRQLSSDYLRSPAFLALMKLNLTLLTLPRGAHP